MVVNREKAVCVAGREEVDAAGIDQNVEINALLSEIQERLPELRARCQFWPDKNSLRLNPALREIELDTLRKLRLFVRMLNKRLGPRSDAQIIRDRAHNA
jgi:hypothetical protein